MDAAVAPSHRTAKPPGEKRAVIPPLRSEHSVVRALHAATAGKEKTMKTLREQAEALERARARRNFHGAGSGRKK